MKRQKAAGKTVEILHNLLNVYIVFSQQVRRGYNRKEKEDQEKQSGTIFSRAGPGERKNSMIDRYPVRIDPLERMGWIDLYLPDDYYASDRRYPVLYMFDGQNLFFDQQAAFGYSWRLKRFLDTCDNPCIVVGLECDPKDQNRLHEYTPYPLPHTFFGRTIGAGAVLMEWIVQFLKPRIDAGLRTWPQREATAIAGSSMGGLMAFFAAVRHNNIFSKAACLSPSIFICQEQIGRELKGKKLNPDTRIYWSFGSRELQAMQRVEAEMRLNEYKDALERKGGIGKVAIVQGGKHDEETWSRQNPDYYQFFWNDPEDLD